MKKKQNMIKCFFACGKPWYQKWWIWVIVLIFISVPFAINEAYKYGENAGTGYYTMWKASDMLAFYGSFLTFGGTTVLGYIAWQQNKKANDINKRLIDLQKTEYMPVLTATSFIGITKFSASPLDKEDDNKNKILLSIMNCEDDEIVSCYSLFLFDDDVVRHVNNNCRSYELHLKYLSKTVVSKPVIKQVSFRRASFNKSFIVNSSFDLSLIDQQELIFTIYLISNDDFLDVNAKANQFLKAVCIDIEFEFVSLSGTKYQEVLTINKHWLQKTAENTTFDNSEMFVSSCYNVQEELSNGQS